MGDERSDHAVDRARARPLHRLLGALAQRIDPGGEPPIAEVDDHLDPAQRRGEGHGGHRAALDEHAHLRVDAAFRDEGFVRVVTLARPVLREPPAFVVRVGELRVTLLEALYGKDNVRRVGREYEQWLARQELTARAPTPMHITAPCAVGPIEFTEVGRPCVVGVHATLDAYGQAVARHLATRGAA